MNDPDWLNLKMRRKAMGCSASFLCLPRWAKAGWFSRADSDIPTVPPRREFKWNIGPKASRIEQIFIVTEYRPYHFSIGFGSPVASDDKEHQDWRKDQRVWDFIGGRVGTASDTGVVVPVHIQVQKIDDAGNTATLTDETVNTKSRYAGGNVIQRAIVNIKLQPGKYQVIATTLQETVIPEGIGTYLLIGFYPKGTVLKDND